MVGRDLKLSGFVELSSLLLYAGWALPSCNMPAAHSIVTGSILNKQVYQADDKWGQPWDEISEAMRVYAVADIKYGWLVCQWGIPPIVTDVSGVLVNQWGRGVCA